MAKNENIDKGWVVASMNGTFVIEYSFARTKSESIKKWMKLWDPARTSWRKMRKDGYKCVKATQTTKIL